MKLNNKHDYPHDWYVSEYYSRGSSGTDSAAWNNFLKIQDEFAALCYTLGSAHSYEEAASLAGLLPVQTLLFRGEAVNNHQGELTDGWIPLYDTVYLPDKNFLDQITWAQRGQSRFPNKVIDMGSGKGILASCISHLGIPTITVDPAGNDAYPDLDQSNISHYDFFDLIPEKELSSVDTIIFCSSIEHMPEDYVFEILSHLPEEARLIVCNTICNHPPNLCFPDHITLIDDGYFSRLNKQLIKKLIYQEGSHFVGSLKG